MIAIFGGSFNPPTKAHIKIARCILNREEISKVIVLPMACNYEEKKNLISESHRHNMLKVCFKDDENIRVSTIDFKSENQLRTYEYMELFEEIFTEPLAHIFGTDNLKSLPYWDESEMILDKYNHYIIGRTDEDMEAIVENDKLLKKYKNKITLIPTLDEEYECYKKAGLSSTKVRGLIKEGKLDELDEGIIDEVKDYIIENGLYS